MRSNEPLIVTQIVLNKVKYIRKDYYVEFIWVPENSIAQCCYLKS